MANWTQREFTRSQVRDADSTTDAIQIGSDGNAAFTAHSFSASRDPHRRWYGVQFQMSLSDKPSSCWAGISNVGDGLGRFGYNFNQNVGACVSGLPEGAWVRGHIYRLDGDDNSSAWLSVRTSRG